MVMAYLYYRALGNTQLAAIGLLSFAAIAQLAPAFFGGLFWRRAEALCDIKYLTEKRTFLLCADKRVPVVTAPVYSGI